MPRRSLKRYSNEPEFHNFGNLVDARSCRVIAPLQLGDFTMNDTSPEKLPRARTEGLILQRLPDEVLVYDTARDRAHCLNETVATVWEYCDGQTSIPEMRERLERDLSSPVTEEMVWCSLHELGKSRLLEKQAKMPAYFDTVTRRDFMRNVARRTAIALPVILSIAAPTRAQAASCIANGMPCVISDTCCSGPCNPITRLCPGLG